MKTAQYWIEHLELSPHPEGGWYRETYRSEDHLGTRGLPPRYAEPRVCSTAILFLLAGAEFSAFHRLRSDELWHFHTGVPLVLEVIQPDGTLWEARLGNDPDHGASFQAVVRAGEWVAARVSEPDSYALVGCTVAPGFEFADFELGRRDALIELYPQHTGLITRFTRPAATATVV